MGHFIGFPNGVIPGSRLAEYTEALLVAQLQVSGVNNWGSDQIVFGEIQVTVIVNTACPLGAGVFRGIVGPYQLFVGILAAKCGAYADSIVPNTTDVVTYFKRQGIGFDGPDSATNYGNQRMK